MQTKPYHFARVSSEHYLKVSDCLDVLPPNADLVYRMDLPASFDWQKFIVTYEAWRWHIIIDIPGLFYETAEP